MLIVCARSMLAFVLLFAGLGVPSRSSAQVSFDAEVVMLPGGDLSPGGNSLWRLSMTNTGSVPIDTPVAGTSFIEVGWGRTLIFHPVPETAPCRVYYTDFYHPTTQQVEVFADLFFADSPLGIGATTSCVVGITIDETAPAFFVQLFGFQGGTGAGAVSRFVSIPIQTGPVSTTAIPALWPLGSIALALCVLVMARSRMVGWLADQSGGR